MANLRMAGFIRDTATMVGLLLQVADNWSALKEEYAALTTNGTLPTQADVDAVFGTGTMTLAQYNQALTLMQARIDDLHVPATRAALYRLKQ